MKFIYLSSYLILLLVSCKTPTESISNTSNEREESLVASDTVVINSDENTYEIIVIDPGFVGWLNTIARPKGYYSQQFLEQRNIILAQNWNLRYNQPSVYNPDLYQLPIDYDSRTDYGYELNYKLYNYFIYFQLKYKQKLGPFEPRI